MPLHRRTTLQEQQDESDDAEKDQPSGSSGQTSKHDNDAEPSNEIDAQLDCIQTTGTLARDFSYVSTNQSHRTLKRRRKHRFKKGRLMIGLEPRSRIKQHHPGAENLLWSRLRSVMQEPFSEFLGVLVFTMISQGGLAQATLSIGETSAPGGAGFGSFLTVPFTYLNPAITFSNCLFRGLPWRSFPLLTLSQILGSFCGTGITYGVYLPAINQFSGGLLHAPPSAQATASIFTSFPQAFSSRTSEVFSVIQRTAIMQCVVAALKDDYNLGQKVSSGGSTNFPLNLFFLFFGLTAAFGWQTGGQANPALDLGGRIMLSVLGYPSTIWSTPDFDEGYPWIPIICPFIGASFGAWMYDMLVFTGNSPVNSPWVGLKKLVRTEEDNRNRQERYQQRTDPEQGIP